MKFFWQKNSPLQQATLSGIVASENIEDYTYNVVGESFRHDHLVQLAQKHKAIDVGSIFTSATLKLEPENVFDPTAVMVIVEGLHVGYIAKSQSTEITANIKKLNTTEIEVPAHLGWDTENPQPYIGVQLMLGDLFPIN